MVCFQAALLQFGAEFPRFSEDGYWNIKNVLSHTLHWQRFGVNRLILFMNRVKLGTCFPGPMSLARLTGLD